MGQRHACKNCGYKGSFVIEADSREDALRIQEEIQADYEQGSEGEDDATGSEREPDRT